MWKCANCGEDENEDSFNFCSTCGTPKHGKAPAPPKEMDVKTAFTAFSGDPPRQNGAHHAGEPAAAASVQKWHKPHPLRAIGQRFKGALTNGHLNHVKVSSEAQDKLTTLVQAGVFRSKSEAAAYLIERGISAETKLFEVVRQKLSEIERIELELRNLVKHEAD
ncbi:MAG TPA: zinc ribbon domain-containing protein [Pyrinomonadaceae bacterium]|nr:zinc ribbon domain-containing protein [Pyrinomonadaceae bacterium]